MDASFARLSTPVLLFPTFVLAGVAYVTLKFNTRISPTIPYAREQSLGERLQAPVEYGKDPAEFLRKTRRQLGDVFCVDLFAAKIVFLLGPEGNKEVMRATEEKLSFVAQLEWALGPVAQIMFDTPDFLSTGTKLVRAYLVKQSTLDYFALHCSKVTEEHFEAWAAQDTIPLFKSFSDLVITYMLLLLVGEDFCRAHAVELVPLMEQVERDLQHPLLRMVPNRLWGLTAPGRRLFKTRARFDELIAAEFLEIREHPEEHAGRGDYFAHLVQNLGDKFKQCYGCHIMFMVFAGHANAAMTIPWMFLHARRVPGALERIREEAVLPPDERKPFLDACLRETGRLYTNTTIMRKTRAPVRIAGHAIPAGTLIAASPLATQRADVDADSSSGGIYEHATQWNPDRFLAKDEDGTAAEGSAYTSWFQRAEFVQFGIGVHACAGEKLTRVLIFDLVLRRWMEKFDFEVTGGLDEGRKGIDGVGAEAAWTEENFGTPSVRGTDPLVSVKKRALFS